MSDTAYDNAAKMAVVPVPSVGIRHDGKLVYDDVMIGRVDGGHVTLDLGWCKAAGVKITIKADPDVDRIRGGVVLER